MAKRTMVSPVQVEKILLKACNYLLFCIFVPGLRQWLTKMNVLIVR